MGRRVMTRVVTASLLAGGCHAVVPSPVSPVSPVSPMSPVSPVSPGASAAPQSTPRQFEARGRFTVNRGTVSRSRGGYQAGAVNESAILVSGPGRLALTDPQVDKTGSSASNSESGFFGVNAAVLAQSGGSVAISGGSVTTDGAGASGLFAYGQTSTVSMTGGTIETSADYSHGASAADQGRTTLARVKVTTSGVHSAAVLAARGGGEVTMIGGELSTSGCLSAGAYSMGSVTCVGARVESEHAEGLVVDGASSLSAKDCVVRGAYGARIFRLGGRRQGPGVLTLEGGRLVAEKGDTFQVRATTGLITVRRGVRVRNRGRLLHVTRGARAALTVDGSALEGDVVTDGTSSATVELRGGARLTGRISRAALALDASSRWSVTEDSVVGALTGARIRGGGVENVAGNGHVVRYDPRLPENRGLGGRSYALAKGGHLLPGR
ncbi:hypothetical protein [Microtetraspora fusca]|uniref:hypothetical protein n=1 Tax=Microtetraspora fusca TaxID=1997 RepID=UPI000B1F3AC2|nr:hypothetical protein [Microtetraspora fusca]